MIQIIANTYGKIRAGKREYVLNCAGECGRQEVDYFENQKQFIVSLKDNGWKKIDNTWFCQYCKGGKP